ncbi:hypothetical protein KC19_VG239900 [Ceratodon purpureus]|uniref:Uncharacterized protein n=1 Tax=Ceratodon purpureus TaxID=3225 RepID=A0A8T0HTJ4_CERPU|nr:hypothetical protein KC19_VG238300 [Ceratodon purpureus]KAG0574166.1 hypothetical protein KC19_VG239900 [Ceratodon purpureus]
MATDIIVKIPVNHSCGLHRARGTEIRLGIVIDCPSGTRFFESHHFPLPIGDDVYEVHLRYMDIGTVNSPTTKDWVDVDDVPNLLQQYVRLKGNVRDLRG